MKCILGFSIIGLLGTCAGPLEQKPQKPDANLMRLVGTWEGQAPDNGPDIIETFSVDGRHTMRMSSIVEVTEVGHFKLHGDTIFIWAEGPTDTLKKKWMMEPGDSILVMTYKTYVSRYSKVRQ